MDVKEISTWLIMIAIAVGICLAILFTLRYIYDKGYSQGQHDERYAFAYVIDSRNNTCSAWSTENGTICNYPDCVNICWNREFIHTVLNKTNDSH